MADDWICKFWIILSPLFFLFIDEIMQGRSDLLLFNTYFYSFSQILERIITFISFLKNNFTII